MTIDFDAKNSALTVLMDGEIDHHTAKGIREKIDLSVERQAPDLLIMDFRNVTFTDSSGIGLVMGRYRLMNMRGGHVLVINLSTQLKKVFSLAGLSKLGIIEEELR